MTNQTELPGCESPERSPAIDRQIEAWYAERAAGKLQAERTAVALAKLLELCEEESVEKYPFLEPGSGKRKVLDVVARRKVRVVRAVSPKKEQADREWEAQRAEGRGEAAAKLAYVTTVVGGNAQPRPDPEPDDPFAATREKLPARRLTGDIARGVEELTPAQLAVREAEEARAARRASGRRAKP